MKIGIIDYGMGNIKSITNAVNHLNHTASLLTNPDSINDYDFLILPGVGAFSEAMSKLNETGMNHAIIDCVKNGKKILGICLGMQLLFAKSYEFGETTGLGLVEGDVVPFDKEIALKVPHMGWNEAIATDNYFKDLSGDYYFVHSYYCLPKKKEVTLFLTNYGINFCSAINLNSQIYGVQFHPEKSQHLGMNLLKRILV